MQIDISKGIKVGGHTYKVKSGERINERLKEGNYYGRCYYKEKEVLIDDSQEHGQVSNSIIHEVVHAIDNEFDTKLSESQVKRLSNGLHQVMSEWDVQFVIKPVSKED